jgi:hypothetical protein
MTITATKSDAPTASPFACSFCGRAEGDLGVDVLIVGTYTSHGVIVCICNCCTASAASSIRGIRMQRLERLKGKRKK